MSGNSPDVLVVGAGIVGACCAWAFSREGLKVTVVDRAGIGQGATAAGMGHIVVMDDSEPQFELCRYSQVLWNELRASAPAELEWVSCGTLWVANDQDEMGEAVRKHEYFAKRGVTAETLDEKPPYRKAFDSQRCLVLANGFYEWQTKGAKKQPYKIAVRNGTLVAFAGLWERWTPESGEEVMTFTGVTTRASKLVSEVHDRMPVIIAPPDHQRWLTAPAAAAKRLLVPFGAIDVGVNDPLIEGPPRTVNVAEAVLPLPPFVDVTFDVVIG